jgi:hypothetical protein
MVTASFRSGIRGDVRSLRGRIPACSGTGRRWTSKATRWSTGRPWTDPGVLGAVQQIVRPGAQLVRDDSLDRFDILPLLVPTDGAIAAFGRDR